MASIDMVSENIHKLSISILKCPTITEVKGLGYLDCEPGWPAGCVSWLARCCCWWPLQRFAWREDRTLVGNETEGSEDDARNVAKGLKTDPPYTSDDFGE